MGGATKTSVALLARLMSSVFKCLASYLFLSDDVPVTPY